jgi:hypothetical protein
MAGNKLRQLSDQIDFLRTLEQDSLDECFQEYGSLMLFLEKSAAKEGSVEVSESIEMLKGVLGESRDKILAEYESDLAHLSTQKQILSQALSITDSSKLSEIEEIILEEVGDLDDNEEFKKRVKEENLSVRQDFLQMIQEIKEIVEEGAIDDLAAFFESSSLDKGDEESEEDENSDDDSDDDSDINQKEFKDDALEDTEEEGDTCSLDGGECTCKDIFDLASNEKIVDFLKKYSEPYFVENKK